MCFEGSVHRIKKNIQSLVFACKEIGLEINADKTKYMVMYRDQDAGRSDSIQRWVLKIPAWHIKSAPNGKCCEGYIAPSMVG